MLTQLQALSPFRFGVWLSPASPEQRSQRQRLHFVESPPLFVHNDNYLAAKDVGEAPGRDPSNNELVAGAAGKEADREELVGVEPVGRRPRSGRDQHPGAAKPATMRVAAREGRGRGRRRPDPHVAT
jgi:hypothetical protein